RADHGVGEPPKPAPRHWPGAAGPGHAGSRSPGCAESRGVDGPLRRQVRVIYGGSAITTHPAYRLPRLLEQSINCHPPSRHGWLGIGYIPSAEEHRMLGIAGLVGSDDVLA